MSTSKNVWARLVDLCQTLHALIYDSVDIAKAKTYLPALESLLSELPDDDESIVGPEAFAILHELREELDMAIEYRKREVQLMERLYEDIRGNNYDDDVKQALLEGRDSPDLEIRKAIVRDLELRC